MKTLRLELNLSNLGEQTHIWFPAPRGKFDVTPTEIQADKKYHNKVAYFYKESPWRPPAGEAGTPRRLLNTVQITANFPTLSTKILAITSKNKNHRVWLMSNRFVQSNDDVIKKLADTLTERSQTDEEKARRCFDFVVGYLTYANPIRGLYSSLQALTDRGVDCGGFSTLLTALLRAVEIPARCVFGWAIRSKFGYHAWVEYYDRQKYAWIPTDPSIAHLGNRTKLNAGFGFINDDRVTLSVGEDIELIGRGIKWPTPLLQSPVVVSLDKSGLPKSISQNLKWSVG